MALLKNIHHGVIQHNGHIVKTLVESNRQKLIYELNTWFLDYCYANNLDIEQLPPLDDWTRSDEDASCWAVEFPDATWQVSIRHELMEFTK